MVQDAGGGSSDGFLTAAFDAVSGAVIWGGYQLGVGYAIAASGDPATVVATGRSDGDWMTTAFRGTSPTALWTEVRDFDGHDDEAFDVAFNSAGNAMVTGYATQDPDLNKAVKSLAINVTAVGATAAGHLQLYPGNVAPPNTSVINFAAGQTRANSAILNLATNAAGTFAIRSGLPPGQAVHVIVDVAGYFD